MSQPGRTTPRLNSQEVLTYQQELAKRAQEAIGHHEQEEKIVEKQIKQLDKGPKLPSDQVPPRIDITDFYAKNNAIEHRTDLYEQVTLPTPVPVFRRGQAFYLGIRFLNRAFNPETDWLKLIFLFGPNPNIARGTRVEVLLCNSDKFCKEPGKFDIRIHHQEGLTLTLHVQIPSSLYVGLWNCRIQTGLKNTEFRKRFDCNDIYVLFNPWCKEDLVYLENEELRKEYVLSDVGKLYMGVHSAPCGRTWCFGQFDDVILPACMLLLDRAKLDYTTRGDPVKFVRAISAVINSRDDDGLLMDNWSGDYTGGTSPMDWTGSLKIFEEFVTNGGHPVKFGQCWVYSGCVTTMCRALGIPSRSVTNYVSAHDCHNNLTVDKFYDCDGVLKCDMDETDSVWNFHVWNEAWMARPDLPAGYGGWQAIDATPQEQSEDVYQLGPASVHAVRKGEIGLQYDTMFVLSEVNADVIHWQDDEESEIGMKQIKTQKYFIGKKILTKAPGKFDSCGITDAEDIIQQYKNPEGSMEERMQVMNAARSARLWYLYDSPKNVTHEDVAFDLLEIDSILIGQPFKVTVQVENKTDQKRTVYAVLSASSVFYTGVNHCIIKQDKHHFELGGNQKRTVELEVRAQDYLSKLVDYSMIKIHAIANVEETRQTWSEEDDFAVDKPELKLEVRGKVEVNKPFTLFICFTNVLPTTLNKCHFRFEGPGLSRPKEVRVRNIQPGETFSREEKFVPVLMGERKIVATFGSTGLSELSGTTSVNVLPSA